MPSTAFITPFRRVQAGWSVATTTTHLLPIILFVVAYERGGPALLAGCSVAIAVLGAAAASGVGALVDRFDLAIVLRAVTAMGSIALVACAVTALARWSGVLAIAFGSIGVAIFSTFRP
ncbi:MAG: hypothetical protein ABI131_06350, partial [Nostocoides sp.]